MIYSIISLIGLVLSFFFAGSETAFISTNRFRFELWLKQKKRLAKSGQRYFEKPELFLSTTLVGNNIANILTSSYATVFLISYFSETIAWLIITFTLLLIGEITPKVIFRSHANYLILRLVLFIRIFNYLLAPFIWLAGLVSSKVLKFLHVREEQEVNLVDKKDIEILLREAKIAGVVDDDEHKIIKRVLELPNTLVREAMIPRTAIKAIDYKQGLKGLKALIGKSGNTKIPVYRGSIDNIIGIVFIFDLFNNPGSLDDIMRPVYVTPENKRCNELLREFKATNTTFAVVIDEYGGTAGIITVEDLMEELFGEFDELPVDDTVRIRALNKTTFKVKADEPLENINEQLDLNIPAGNYETLGGYVIAELGRIPVTGEAINQTDYRIVVTKATEKKIEEMRVIKLTI